MLGDRLHKHLETAVISSDFLILFLSPDSVLSRWVDEEWRLKYEQQLEGARAHRDPRSLEDCDVPPTLKGRLMLRCKTTSELLRAGDSWSWTLLFKRCGAQHGFRRRPDRTT